MAGKKRQHIQIAEGGPDFSENGQFEGLEIRFSVRARSPHSTYPPGTQSNPIDLIDREEDTGPEGGTVSGAMNGDGEQQIFATLQVCLEYTRDVFPDISHNFVMELYQDTEHTAGSGMERCVAIVDRVLALEKYPKQKDETSRSGPPPRESTFGADALHDDPHIRKAYGQRAELLLKDEFERVPVRVIKETLNEKKRLYDAYLALAEAAATQNSLLNASRIRKRRKSGPGPKNNIASLQIGSVDDELQAARREHERRESERATAAAAARQEAQNELEARSSGQIRECACCFSETPLNRMGHCAGGEPHYFCLTCIKMNAETELGNSRCRPRCMDMSECQAPFAEYFLRRSLDEKSLDRLIRQQRREDLKAAGIDGLEECSFCDFLMICPPVDVDREFRCEDSGCGKVSCRLCQHETHTPLSCDEAEEARAKDSKIEARHAVEEAMTKALVRSCNKCSTPFVKIEGCNKMTCNRCGNRQCYVCSKNISGYEHFGNGGIDEKCPAYDDRGVEAQHQKEVQEAEKAAAEKVRAQRPDIQEEDLLIKVSAAVKLAEEEQARLGPRDDWLGHHAWLGRPPIPQAQYQLPPEDHRAAIEAGVRMAQRDQAGRAHLRFREVNWPAFDIFPARGADPDAGEGEAQQAAGRPQYDQQQAFMVQQRVLQQRQVLLVQQQRRQNLMAAAQARQLNLQQAPLVVPPPQQQQQRQREQQQQPQQQQQQLGVQTHPLLWPGPPFHWGQLIPDYAEPRFALPPPTPMPANADHQHDFGGMQGLNFPATPALAAVAFPFQLAVPMQANPDTT